MSTRSSQVRLGPRGGTVTSFMRMARTHAACTASDAVVATALAGTIFFEGATSGARGKVFLYLLLTAAPFAVVAPLIGPALDRAVSGRRWVVVGSAAIRALLCLALIGRTGSLVLYPAAFGILVLQKAYGIARSSLVPGVVESDEELVEANSKLQLLSGIMGFAGALPAAAVFKLSGDSSSATLVLAVIGFSATAALALKIPSLTVAPTDATPQERAELRSVGVILAASGMGLLRGIVGFLTLHFAFYFREADELVAFGVVAGVSVAGSLAGSVIAPRLRQVWPEERMLISVLVLTLATGVMAVTAGGVVGAAMLGAMVGIASTSGKLAFDSIVQRDAPDANRGRLFAKFETRFQLIWVFGSMLGLVPMSELRLSFLAVALVAGFAAFSYIVGLSAWRHRLGETDSEFGRQAVIIDQTMTAAKDRGKEKVRAGSKAIASKVRHPRDAAPVPPAAPGHAGPGIGVSMTPMAGTPAASGTRRGRRRGRPRDGADQRRHNVAASPTPHAEPPPPSLAKPPAGRPRDEWSPRDPEASSAAGQRSDPTTFAPRPTPEDPRS